MSTLAAVLTIYALLSASASGTYVLIRHASGRESTRDRLIRQAHERATDAAVLGDAAINAGCDRLRDAIHDHRKEEEA